LLCSFTGLLLHQGAYLERQAEQVDESRGVSLVVDIIVLERDEFLAVERIRAREARGDDVALVQLELDRARYGLLRAVDKSGQGFAQLA
jgi:hypothetical protein